MGTKASKVKQTEVQESKELAVHYMSTLVDVARESFLILDSSLRVVSANPIFYKTFQVSAKQTEHLSIFDLGNGQWNIPELKKLLKEILPKKKAVNDFEVEHTFETIGKKTIQLNAKQIDSVQLVILAMEDITSRKEQEQILASYTKRLEEMVDARTSELTKRVNELETLNKTMIGRELKMVEQKKEIGNLKKSLKSGTSNDGLSQQT